MKKSYNELLRCWYEAMRCARSINNPGLVNCFNLFPESAIIIILFGGVADKTKDGKKFAAFYSSNTGSG